MTTKEKAKAYDIFFERLKEMYNNNKTNVVFRTIVERYFPELKESEDEKIRKELYIYLDWLDGRKDYAPRGEYTIRDMISWLEKQGEQNPDNKVGPKFKAGDWITIKE